MKNYRHSRKSTRIRLTPNIQIKKLRKRYNVFAMPLHCFTLLQSSRPTFSPGKEVFCLIMIFFISNIRNNNLFKQDTGCLKISPYKIIRNIFWLKKLNFAFIIINIKNFRRNRYSFKQIVARPL